MDSQSRFPGYLSAVISIEFYSCIVDVIENVFFCGLKNTTGILLKIAQAHISNLRNRHLGVLIMAHNYECPRCGYATKFKGNMRTHFDRKTKCFGHVDYDIVLTDAIKQHILENHVYRPKKAPHVIEHITIQNTQMTQIYTYMNKLELGDKVLMLNVPNMQQCSDKVISLIEWERNIWSKDEPGLEINDKDVENMVGKMCRVQNADMSDMNVLLDSKSNNMMIYEGNQWLHHDIEGGSRFLFMVIYENFMKEHERYLLRCHNNTTDMREKQDIRDQILKYYRMIAAFDFEPYCYNKTDDEIYDNGSMRHYCEEEFYPKYKKIVETMTNGQKRSWAKLIVSTIKNNSKFTNMALNKKLFELSQKDDPNMKRVLGIE